MNIVAIIKHIKIRNSNYDAATDYLCFKHDEFTNKPILNEITDFQKFIAQDFKGQKFICHCYEGEKPLLKETIVPGEDALILIGPEGDFSEEEVSKAIEAGFQPVSLGKSRLRTETAALVAAHTLNLFNQK